MTFETVSEATRIWIKGRDFSVSRLLGDAYKSEANKYVGGALGIFRLAPQDYHRFHTPVDGVIGPMTYIAGEYYTVNVSWLSHFSILPFHNAHVASSYPHCA
jgi:phosphatidylserine decarboxylase